MVPMLKLGHVNICFITVSTVNLLPCSLTLFYMGILLWSQTGSAWSLSQLVCTRNQVSSSRVQQAWVPSGSRSMTMPSLGPTPATMQQTGAEILSVRSLLVAASQLVSSSRTFLMSQQVGMALFLITLIRSSSKLLAFLVSTLTEKAPYLMPVRVKTEAATVQEVQSNLPSRQQSMVTSNLLRSSHISKSKLRPCMTVPSWLRTRNPVQAGKVENSYMKLQKKIFQKGYPLSLANASTSATKSLYLNSVRAQTSTPSQKVLGTGSRSMNSMKRERGCMKSRTMGAQRTAGGSLSETLQTRGTWAQMGSR